MRITSKLGIVGNGSSEIRNAYLKVVTQDPAGGTIVNYGTAVSCYVVPTDPIPGFSAVDVTNENTDGRSITVFLADGIAAPKNMGSIGVGQQLKLQLQDGHNYIVTAVDVGLINCPRA